MELKGIVESLIFASNKPLTLQQLRNLTNTPLRQLKAVLEELQADREDSGIQIAEVGGGYQFRTHPEAVNWVRRLLAGRPQRMTRPMLETLAIIAYQQPITRPEIEEIRGVDCGNTLRVLLERNLLRILGKKEEVGRPLLYGTTKFFLEFFQLPSLKDLPTLKEFTELSPEHEEQVHFFFGNKGQPDASSEPLEGPPEPPHLRPPPPQPAAAPGEADQEELSAAPTGEDQGEAQETDAPPSDAASSPSSPEQVATAEVAPDAAADAAPDDAPDTAPSAAPDDVPEEAGEPTLAAEEPTAAPATAEAPSAAPAPPTPVVDEAEEDDAVLDSLDRAIARAGSVLREINPRPKRQRAEEGTPPKAAAETAPPTDENAASAPSVTAAEEATESKDEDGPATDSSNEAKRAASVQR